MDNIQRLKGSHAGYRAHVTCTFKKADDIMNTGGTLTPPQIVKLTSIMEQLTQKRDTLKQLNTQVLDAILSPEELETEILEAEEIQDNILEYMAVIKSVIEPRRTTVESTPLSITAPPFVPTPAPTDLRPARELVSRLPKLTLPVFTGDPLMWQPFRDSFDSAIHNSPSLSKVQKFNHLRAQLQGDASRVIAGLPLTQDNYDDAIELLSERYGQPHKIVEAHMKALSAISSPSNTLSSLQLYYDTIQAHLRGLAALGKTEDSFATMLIPAILSKLPVDIRRNLAHDHSNKAWTMTEVKEAILKEIAVLECSWSSPKGPSTMSTTLLTNTSGRHMPPPHQGTNKSACVFCKGLHFSGRCETVRDAQKRLDIVKKGKLCFNCLSHHRVSQCLSKSRCKSCQQKHHTSLCGANFNSKPPEVPPVPDAAAQPQMPPVAAQTITTQATTSDNTPTTTGEPTAVTAAIVPPEPVAKPTNSSICLLKTAVAQINVGGVHVETNILFDEGAQRSFITEQLANTLRISPHTTENVSISAFGDELSSFTQLGVATINVVTLVDEQIPISVLVVPVIAAPLHNTYHNHLTQLKYLQGLRLANPVTKNNFEIVLLIGADYYWQFVGDQIIHGDGPTAMDSKLGYLLSGPVARSGNSHFHTKALHIGFQPAADNTEFWRAESTGATQQPEPEEDFLTRYQDSCIRRDSDGAYCVKFPWKPDHPPLPSNYSICKNITRSLAHRLRENPELLHLYGKIISEQEEKGFIEKVPDPIVTRSVHYIPHHPIRKVSSTTPVRIVYNCSCRQSTLPSLNDCLMTGPSFLADLCGILLRFRWYTFGISTDLEKAFLHVRLDEGDRDYTRFLWLSTPSDPDSKLITYRFKTVLFGSTSSPFMLNATLQHHLNSFDTSIARDMKRNLYMDNIISGCDSEDQVVEYYKEARTIMSQAKFNLRSWASNSNQLQALAKSEGTANKDSTVSLLGLLWSTSTDIITFSPKQFLIPTEEHSMTKRIVLQAASRIYDPLGFLSPITIRAKILIQELWQSGVDWDEPVQHHHNETWIQIATDLQEAANLTIRRCYFTSPSNEPVELHAFSDASMKAYGAVVFIRTGTQTSFVVARSRVVPLKDHTLPRLELMGAVIASRLAQFVISALHYTTQNISTTLWSDSQIVLHWLHSSKRLKQFIANRVQEINTAFPDIAWCYCPTNDNPADLLTRRLTNVQLNSSQLWQHGPQWLTNPAQRTVWNHSEILHLQIDEEVVTDSCMVTQSNTAVPGIHNIINISNYSTLERLLRVSAYVLRFIGNIKPGAAQNRGTLAVHDINKSLSLWIHSCQQTSFSKEIHSLHSQVKQKHKRLPIVRQLCLFLDQSGYIHCVGSIHNAPVKTDTKFPYLLPMRHHLTKLLVYSIHKQHLHAGVNSTVTALRQRYWVPSARQLVRRLLRKCVPCLKTIGKPYSSPESPPLPHARTQEGKPFEVTGVDFTGALYVRDPGNETKAYICLFTCGLSRVIHLEVVRDLTVDTFMQAFRRFAARKSLPRLLLSDNASTYVSAAKELEQLFSSDKLEESLSTRGVQWKFIPKRAAWYGGFWERFIGMTKNVLKKVLGRSFITFEALQTLAVEIEGTLNDHPLTYLSADIGDPDPLTPSHLLYGRRIMSLPYTTVEDSEISDPTSLPSSAFQERAKRQTQILQHFQQRWKREYLTSLRERHKGADHSKQNISVGDVVVVHDDVPRSRWQLAVIEELIEGLDGGVRAAKIRTANGKTNRPVTKLFPLEVNDVSETSTSVNTGDDNSNKHGDDEKDTSATVRESIGEQLTWKAAIRARKRIKGWTDILSVALEDVAD